MGHAHQRRQVTCAGLVVARQARRLDVARIRHAQLTRLGIHAGDEGPQPAGVGTPKGMRRAVLTRHQRQVQHLAPRQRGAHAQARATALFCIDVVLGDGQRLVHGQMRLGNQEPRHELGQRSDRQNRLVILAEQHFMRILVNHQGDAGLERKRVADLVQSGQLAKRLPLRRHIRRTHRGFGAAGHLARRGRFAGCRTLGGGGADLLLLGRLLGRGMGHGDGQRQAQSSQATPLGETFESGAVGLVHPVTPSNKKSVAV